MRRRTTTIIIGKYLCIKKDKRRYWQRSLCVAWVARFLSLKEGRGKERVRKLGHFTNRCPCGVPALHVTKVCTNQIKEIADSGIMIHHGWPPNGVRHLQQTSSCRSQ